MATTTVEEGPPSCPLCTIDFDDADATCRPNRFECCGNTVCSSCLAELQTSSDFTVCPFGCDLSAVLGHSEADGSPTAAASASPADVSTSASPVPADEYLSSSVLPESLLHGAPAAADSRRSSAASGRAAAAGRGRAAGGAAAVGTPAAQEAGADECAFPSLAAARGVPRGATAAVIQTASLRQPHTSYRAVAGGAGEPEPAGSGEGGAAAAAAAAPADAAAAAASGAGSGQAQGGPRGVIKVFWDIENAHLHESEEDEVR